MKRSFAALTAAALIAVASPALAAGFSIYEWDAWGVALGEAMMFGDSPSILGYNPAGMTSFGREGSWTAGAVRILPVGEADFYRGNTKVGSSDNILNAAYAPYGFYVRQVEDNLWFGLGLYPRFGLSSKFSPDFPGRFSSYLADFKTMSLAVNFAWKLSPTLSMSLGGELMYADLVLQRAIGGTGAESHMDLHGVSMNQGWNVALQWKPAPKLSLAAVYRSKVKQTMSHADTTFTHPLTGEKLPAVGRGSVTLPDSWTFGIGWQFDERTRLEFDAIYTRWSSYDSLDITFDTFWPLVFAGKPALAKNFTAAVPKHWENGWRYQIGLEHKLDQHWTLGLGVSIDKDVAPDEFSDFMVPVGDRITYSLGVKYTNRNTSWILGLGYMDISDKNIPNLHNMTDPTLRAYSHDNYATVIGLSCKVDL